MKVLFNRITFPLIFILFISCISSAQGPAGFSPSLPGCAFDEHNQIESEADPDFKKSLEKYLSETVPVLAAQQRNPLEPLLSISVVVHVIHDGEPVGQGGNLAENRIQAQIEVLNEDFSALNEKFYQTPAPWQGLAANPNIQFCLASVDPQGNPTNGITRHNIAVTGTSWNNNNINSQIKPQTKWDPDRYFNVYVLSIPGTTAMGGVVGFSNYPTPSLIGADRDGVVVDYNWFGAPGYGASGWRPLTHETGHYLGLPHTFNGNSCNADDGIADTPNMDASTREYTTLDCSDSFPTGPVSCGEDHLYVNYMDYVTENCYTSFTQGQVNVMRGVLDGTSSGFGYGSREELIQKAPQQCNLAENDAGTIRLISPSGITCTNGTLTPEVTLRNFGVDDLTSVQIRYRVNNGPVINFSWQGNLFPGGETDVALPAFTPSNGSNNLLVYTVDPNGVTDERLSNDTLISSVFVYVAAATPVQEDVESGITFPTPAGFFPFNVTNDDFEWEITADASGFGEGSNSFVFNNYAGDLANNPFGTIDALIGRHLDLSDVEGATLYFDVAYAPYDNLLTDTLILLVATDCSQNFNQQVYRKGGVELSTAPATQQLFTPSSSQWRTETVDLSNYDGSDNLAFAFVNQSGWGNRLFVDNVRIGVTCTTFALNGNTTQVSAFNATDGTATVQLSNGNPPYTYEWSNGVQFTTQNTFHTIQNLASGTYTVDVTDAFGCAGSLELTVGSVCDNLSLSTPSVNVSCNGGSDGSILVLAMNGSSPYSYQWSNGATTQVNNQLPAGTYTVTVTDANECPAEASITLTAPPALVLQVTSTNETGVNSQDGTAVVTVSGGMPGYSYLWSNGATTNPVTNLAAGTYFVTVTDAHDCTATASTVIQSFDCGSFQTGISSTDVFCFEGSNGTATVSVTGGMNPVTFNWSNGSTSATVTGLQAGDYTVTVTDAAGCEAILTTQVDQAPLLSVQATATGETTAGANDGTASAVGSGGTPFTGGIYLYEWSNGANTSQINGLVPDMYSVTVTDANGCTSVATVTVEASDCALQITLGAQSSSCPNVADGAAFVNTITGGTPPFDYSWSNGGQTETIDNLLAGTYVVTVTDANDCTAESSLAVEGEDTTPPTIEAAAFLEVQLDDSGQALVQPADLDNGTFDNCSQVNLELSQTTFTCDHLGLNAVSLTATDADGNTATFEVTIEVSDDTAPTITCPDNQTVLSCDGVSYNMPVAADNCGVASLTRISGPASGDLFPVGTTEVVWKATDESENSANCSFTITVEYDLETALNLFHPSCFGLADGYVELVITGGLTPYQIEWSHGGGSINLGAGTYVVTVTDQNGCITADSFEMQEPPELGLEILDVLPATGGSPTGSISFTILGGTGPFLLNWYENNNLLTGFDPSIALPGTYVLEIVDANGCSVTSDPITVDNLNSLTDQDLQQRVVLFPNPARDKCNIRTTLAERTRLQLEVLDISGKSIWKNDFGTAQHHSGVIDLKELPEGIFWVKIYLGEAVFYKKLIVL